MKAKIPKIIMVVLFAGILIILPILTFITLPSEPTPFSENENRYLAAFPEASVKTYLNEKFMTGFEDWFSDRFFGREQWIIAKNTTERLIGKIEINGIFTGDDRMIQLWKGYDSEHIDKNLAAINKFAASNPDLPVYFLLAPTSQEIYSGIMPASAPIGSQADLYEHCKEQLTDCRSINVFNMLKKHSDEYIYYRTDHHWTSLGAYYAYYEAAKAMGLKPLELSQFDIEHASSDFRGTLFSKTLDFGVTPDVMDYYHIKDADYGLKLTVNTGSELIEQDSLYFREYLDVKDKYSSFMGPNSPLMTVETGIEGPSLLIFKDSYAHSFIPFLANHYSKITVLDMRLNNMSVSSVVDISEYDSVLVLYNAITFSEDKNIRKLNMK